MPHSDYPRLRRPLHSWWPTWVKGAHGLRQVRDELIDAPLTPILHPSPARLRWLGVFTALGHPLFAWIWGEWLKQPYENYWLRALMGASGLVLLLKPVYRDPSSKLAAHAFSAVCWLQLPFLFSWMYLCNHGNTVWLASVCAMILIYYHVTDWRAATIGTVTGSLSAWLLFNGICPQALQLSETQLAVNTVVILFSWSAALLMGISSANLRREHLNHTLASMGIMAHELRTPLATISLIGDAMRGEARVQSGDNTDSMLDKLATRLHTLVRNMNHQIDTQIVNARLLSLPQHTEAVSAAHLLREATQHYPYRTTRERECVVLHVRRDFVFEAPPALFTQVVENLLKNAFNALAAASTPPQTGDLLIEVGILQNKGRIVITDRGIGIDPQLQPRIFEPFFSTHHGTGHGLGLTFCKRVIQSARGSIRVKSEPGKGATFTVELPQLD
ncbi:MAG: sensor histidine kinase [Burkholderiaceae bacterium]